MGFQITIALLIHAKVVIFELQCPTCVRIWRSAVPRILHHFYQHWQPFDDDLLDGKEGYNLLPCIPALQPYFVKSQGASLSIEIHFAFFDPLAESSHPRNGPILCYVVEHPNLNVMDPLEYSHSIWCPKLKCLSFNLSYCLDKHCRSCGYLAKYMDSTSHTSNNMLSAVDCPTDLSLDELITFAHLRSGGSLQWLNILQGLCSRTLNFHHHGVHFLLSHAAFQVGPQDINTGAWIWHQELQDPSFCNTILDELKSLFLDVGSGTINGVLMNTVSLLLTWVLVSSPSEGISDRAIALLRCVCRKTFSWVQELSYDLAKAPMNEERRKLLLDMAATC